MLKIIEQTPVPFGKKIMLGAALPDISKDIFQNGTVYCLKHCFDPRAIDILKNVIFNYYAKVAEADFNVQSVDYSNSAAMDRNHHAIVKGISPYQKTLHYFHSYVFSRMDELPTEFQAETKAVFSSLIGLYNDLTAQHRKTGELISGTKKFRPQLVQYPTGGGMFAAHSHVLEPQKLGIILGFSKRGRDFNEGGLGVEMPGGDLIDTSSSHDIGDIAIFRYDLKHWVTSCDIASALDDRQIGGRWVAAIPIY